MKHLFFTAVAVISLLLTPANMKGQSLKDLVNSSTVKNAVTAVTGGSAITTESLEGTWTYSSPAIQLEGDNALKNVAGSVVTSEAESQLKEYCEKIGIVEGQFNYVFNSDGSFTSALKKSTLKGTYTVNSDDKTVELSYTIAGKSAKRITAQATLSGSELALLFDADKLLSLLNTLSSVSGSTSLSAINSLASQYDNVLIGFNLKK